MTAKEPINDPKSDCYNCTAMMCNHQICSGDQYEYLINDIHDYEYNNKDSIKESKEISKEILICSKDCGWISCNPKEWHYYKRATNGNLLRGCPRCFGFADLKTIKIEQNV